MTIKLPEDLVTVKQYTEMRDLGAVQVLNGWCRKQGAPFHEVEGKRMVSVSEIDEWRAEKDQRRAEGKGTTKADVVQRKTGVKKGAMTMHNSKAGVVIAEVAKITDYVAHAETSHGAGFAMPIRWDALATKLKKGELTLVNPHIISDLMIAHFVHLGEEKHAAEINLLLQLREMIGVEDGMDLLTEIEVTEDDSSNSGDDNSDDGSPEEDDSDADS